MLSKFSVIFIIPNYCKIILFDIKILFLIFERALLKDKGKKFSLNYLPLLFALQIIFVLQN